VVLSVIIIFFYNKLSEKSQEKGASMSETTLEEALDFI